MYASSHGRLALHAPSGGCTVEAVGGSKTTGKLWVKSEGAKVVPVKLPSIDPLAFKRTRWKRPSDARYSNRIFPSGCTASGRLPAHIASRRPSEKRMTWLELIKPVSANVWS